MKEYIKNYCETCKVRLNKKNFKKHFQANHVIRTTGQFVLSATVKPIKGGCIEGIALMDVKAGDPVIIAL